MIIQLNLMDAFDLLKPLVIFVLGMTLYSLFIFKFYRFLARKDVITLNLRSYNNSNHWMFGSFLAIVFYTLEYFVVLPLFIFFWFAVLACLLAFLAKNQTLETILLVAIAVVGAVRMTAFYSEDLSRDLAKMLPFALLGVFLVDITYFNIGTALSLIKEIPSKLDILIYYWAFIVIIEFVLRVFDLFYGKSDSKQKDVETN